MAELGTDLDIEPADDGVTLTGEIDADTAPDLERALDALLESTPATVTMFMGGVTFMDSSGLRVVIAATQRARDGGGDLLLVAPTTAVRRLIEVSGLDGHLSVRDTPG